MLFSDVATVNRLARVIEDQEARRLGIPVVSARSRVANRIGVAPGTLENLRRLRTKIVPNWLMNRLRAEFIVVLQLRNSKAGARNPCRSPNCVRTIAMTFWHRLKLSWRRRVRIFDGSGEITTTPARS